MNKKHFIALAEAVRNHEMRGGKPFTMDQIRTLAKFCHEQNESLDQSKFIEMALGIKEKK